MKEKIKKFIKQRKLFITIIKQRANSNLSDGTYVININ